MNIKLEAFAPNKISFLGEAKMRGMRAFTVVNDRLSRACPMNIVNALGAFLTMHRSERAFVQRSQYKYNKTNPRQSR